MSNYIAENQLPFKYTRAGVIPINTVIFDLDTREIESAGVALHVTSLGSAGQLAVEFSCDETTWATGWLEPASLVAAQVAVITAAGLYIVPKLARFVRLRVSTATTGGTTTIAMTMSYADFRSATPTAAATAVSGTGIGVVGAAAHDAAISGNPERIAGRAVTANYTAVANGDTADIITTLVGAIVAKPYSIPELDWQYAAAAGGIINTTDVAAKAAAAAGIRNYVTSIQVRNTNAVATEFVIKDGATVIWRTQLPASMAYAQTVTFPTPLKGTAATAINIACITTGAAVYANLQGYSAP